MKKNWKFLIVIGHGLGMLVMAFSRIFMDSLSDFALGFCEGFSVPLILLGTVYMCWCAVKKKKPYEF